MTYGSVKRVCNPLHHSALPTILTSYLFPMILMSYIFLFQEQTCLDLRRRTTPAPSQPLNFLWYKPKISLIFAKIADLLGAKPPNASPEALPWTRWRTEVTQTPNGAPRPQIPRYATDKSISFLTIVSITISMLFTKYIQVWSIYRFFYHLDNVSSGR